MGNHGKRKRGQPYLPWINTVNGNQSLERDEVIQQLVEEVFSKEFIYPQSNDLDRSNNELVNVMFSESRWVIPELQEMKQHLNEIKSRLSLFDITKWHQHTSQTHPGGQVMKHMRRAMGAEVCTQAWCKFREIVQRLELISCLPENDIHSVHLCEAPGTFITSLNHYLHNNGKSFFAMNLNHSLR
jgi:cap2 methyltransferase